MTDHNSERLLPTDGAASSNRRSGFLQQTERLIPRVGDAPSLSEKSRSGFGGYNEMC